MATLTVPTSSSSTPNSDLLTSLARDGFVILPSTQFPSLDLAALRAAAAQVTTLARSGAWPHIRTLPKQFPPWTSDSTAGIWGVQHLLHPSIPSTSRLAFASSYFNAALLDTVAQLIECPADELVMELYNLLVRPDADFALRWHRDDIPATATPEEETARLGKPAWHAQWNLALYDDASLIVVPGSHKRARTAAERAAGPFESDMPGQMVVKLKSGEVVFYDNNILHRGVYDSRVERMTLHGSVGCVKGGGARARNVLQHGVGEWVGRCDFEGLEDRMREMAERMRERLVEMGKVSGDVGFYSKEE
ncbi:hypothetical protein K432DRAFT_337638 [Lepidopterella palustris CBS 459.81]|uniref:Phytanoyl-CoA dioxygenase family protein n=1 Tax=Lepidopterella palustris CBS 459.81 TaxID=1314670 RepID=A0A8E2E0V0_9PEZI|nr:hypothetical protein K432DRAFT_337638 [Lepidopterella palustris CBS 459.81]